VRLLLDSHTLLWAMEAPHRLSAHARQLIADPAHQRVLSVASIWELGIKFGAGRLPVTVPFRTLVARAKSDLAMAVLDIAQTHAFRVTELPRHHGDPFDRMLVAQAQVEGMSIVSADPVLSRYEVEVLW